MTTSISIKVWEGVYGVSRWVFIFSVGGGGESWLEYCNFTKLGLQLKRHILNTKHSRKKTFTILFYVSKYIHISVMYIFVYRSNKWIYYKYIYILIYCIYYYPRIQATVTALKLLYSSKTYTFLNKLQHKLFFNILLILFHCNITTLKSYDFLKGFIDKIIF